jgi:prolipoprotein diacylglyceryltransferase
VRDAAGHPVVLGTFQPTFLYESLWCLGVALAVVLIDRRLHLDRGRVFALYVMLYTVGRGWIEYLRVDQATHILGLRLNDWTALLVFLGALYYYVRVTRQERAAPPVEAADVADDPASHDTDMTSAPRDEPAL